MNLLKTITALTIASVMAISLSSVSAQSTLADSTLDPLNKRYMDTAARADSAIKARNWQLAESLLQEAMDLKPGDPSNVLLMSNLGIVRQQTGNYQGAIDALTAANALAPASVTVLTNRARLYVSLGEKEKAVKDYERVIQLDSTLIEPYFYRGMIAFSQGDIVQCDKDFAKLKHLDPDNDYTLIAQATVCTATGRNADAADYYKRLIQREPASEYYGGLIENYIAMGEYNLAGETIGEAMHLYPMEPDFYVARAVLNKKRYMLDEAKADARKAVQLGADPDTVNDILNNN